MRRSPLYVGALLYLLLICLASVAACVYLLWQMHTQPEMRGPDGVLLAFGVVCSTEVLIHVPRLLRPAAGETA